MKVRVSEVRLGLDEDTDILLKKALRKLSIDTNDVLNWWIERQSLDARRGRDISFVYTIIMDIKDGALKTKAKLPAKSSLIEDEEEVFQVKRGSSPLALPPVVVGTGPAGLFAGWLLASMGYRPMVLERGKTVFARQKDVVKFWENGELNSESNVQFGEGGAGTFSDGKLTARIKDKRVKLILNAMVQAGAPEDIIYQAKPHLGTDKLRGIVANLRNTIIELGGQVFFQTRVTGLVVNRGKIEAVVVNNKIEVPVSLCILAAGHSARDTYEMLWKNNIDMQAKPFAIGARIEHPQHMIDCVQFGAHAGHPRLGAADYHLTYRNSALNRAAYSFCMCPGGYVIGASSEPGRLAVNGMSFHDRNSGTANSAIVVTVGERDYDYKDPLSGMKFQRIWEERAFKLGGGHYHAPVQAVSDFLKDTIEETPDRLEEASYKPGVEAANLRECLPKEIGQVLGEALVDFDKKIKGFAAKGILTGVETRTSAPVRIPRGDNLEALGVHGLYPAGEGAGYAGGIISAAVDGIRAAQAIIERYGLPKGDWAEPIIDQLTMEE
ncbi:MAG: FAD-dependent protein [Bacillota bacterium]